MGNTFFIIVILTITATRIFLLIFPIPSPTVATFRLHHYMYGLIGIPIALLVHSIVFYGVAAGLFVDEAAFVVLGGQTRGHNYWSPASLVGTVLLLGFVFLLRHQLVPTPLN